MNFRDMTIRKKLTLLIMGASAIAVMLASIVFYILVVDHFRASYEKSLSGLAEVLALNCRASLAFRLPEEAGQLISSLSTRPSVVYAAIRDSGGNIFASYGSRPSVAVNSGLSSLGQGAAGYLVISQDITMGGRVIGTLTLFDNMRSINRMRLFAFLAALLAVSLAMLVAFVLASRMQKLISGPILALASSTDRIAREQNFSLRADRQGNDEVGLLVDSFNSMIDQIEKKNTEKQHLNMQLQQSQKMEAIGHLAGGIAHDFNNILTAIIGYGSLLGMKIGEKGDLKDYVDQILSSADKAAGLTQQILAFSRKQILEPKETDLNNLISGIQKLLLRLIGEDIDFRIHLADKNIAVMIDRGQIEQVLMNLCTNARDAMPNGGMLSIGTDILQLDENTARLHGLDSPGDYAVISVTDTGIGMDETTSQKIFEPFFTTKMMGKGTGLGLSIVYGIIKQHNGNITVYSEPGRGTTFRIYLQLLKSAKEDVPAARTAGMPRGAETILLAEDNDDVRKLTALLLKEFGYQVIEAVDGEDAINKFSENMDAVQIVMLDVIMPKKSGKEARDQITKIRPDIKVLFTSGYTADIISNKGIVEEGIPFISKPVTPHDLLVKIREVLDS